MTSLERPPSVLRRCPAAPYGVGSYGLLRRNFNVFDASGGMGNRRAIFTRAFKVELHGFANLQFHFCHSGAEWGVLYPSHLLNELKDWRFNHAPWATPA
jgi:hypothetical protein